jgi:DnaJ family protein C protein 27
LGRRRVDESEGRLWAETKGFHYFETSAQSNSNIQEAFETLVQSIVNMMTSKEPHPGGGRARLELGYTPEQAALVSRIRSCHSNYEILNVSRHCSRYIQLNN